MKTTYAVLKSSGELIDTDLTLAQAAQEMLTHDGQDYEIRNDADAFGFTLWSRQQIANRPWHATVIYSGESDKAKAEAEIFAKVIAANWDGQPFATTMQAYEELTCDNV